MLVVCSAKTNEARGMDEMASLARDRTSRLSRVASCAVPAGLRLLGRRKRILIGHRQRSCFGCVFVTRLPAARSVHAHIPRLLLLCWSNASGTGINRHKASATSAY